MKKIGFIILALVVVMGSLGVGYAFWTQSLDISGTADMAELSAEFVDNTASVVDPNGGPATCTSTISSSPSTNDLLTITIDKAYPGYNAVIFFDIKNTGNISAYVTTGTITVTPPDGGAATDITVNKQVPGNAIAPNRKLSWSSNLSQISVYVPGDSVPVEGGKYKISLPLTVHQFNQPNPPPP
jgi:hypothetical protein